tara:strand:- start:71 stop:1717 length:1647 start_codon:yes stop_codon:yes gene_type:complete
MPDVAAYIETAFYLPTSTIDIKFSQIREMYGNEAGTVHASKTFSDYYRDGDIVTDTSYGEGDYKANNEAVNIAKTGALKMSQFRGAAKELVYTVSGNGYNLNANLSKTYKRIYKMVINDILYRSTTNHSAFYLNSSDSNAIFIIQNESTIYGGGGAGGTSGDGGTAGTIGSGAGTTSSYVNGSNGGSGGAGGGGTPGGAGGIGGHCLKIEAYPTDVPLYLFNKGTLKPGGGGGGGTGGGGGSGGSGSGGAGGKGAEGRYNAAGAWTYTYAGYNPVGSTESFWRVLTLTDFIYAGTHNYGNIYWLGSRKLYLELSSTLDGYFFGDDPRGTGSGTGSEGYQYRRGSFQQSQGNPSVIFLYSLARFSRHDGGDGGQAGSSRVGNVGVAGLVGKKGAHYNGTAEVIDTTDNAAVAGGVLLGTRFAGTAGEASTGITTYHWTANGAGGAGGAGGRVRSGFGHGAGGGGGDFGGAGNDGGDGVSGVDSYAEDGIDGGHGGLRTGDQNPFNQRTSGGSKGSGNKGGSGGGHGGGGTGGSVVSGTATIQHQHGWAQ